MNRVDKKFVVRGLVNIIIALFIAFILMDIIYIGKSNNISLYPKYSIIMLCFILSLFIVKDGYNRVDTALIIAARFFTLIADYYLMIIENYKLGVMCFCVVQLIYIIRHSLMESQVYKNIVFLFSSIVIFSVILNKVKVDDAYMVLVMVVFIYAALLITSLYCAIGTLKRGCFPKTIDVFIALGMILFFLCDVNVGLFNIFGFFSLKKYEMAAGLIIWLFYAPSQLLLSLSGFKLTYLKQIFHIKG